MKIQRLAISLAVLMLLPLAAWAQTTPPPTPPPETGSFDKLSPGNQTIAKAIFADQIKPTPPPPAGTGGTGTGTTGSGTTVTTGPQPLTLDQIAKLKLDGQGWGVIFKDLKAQHLVTSKNLGQAVSAFHSHHHLNTGSMTSASNRPADSDVRSLGRAPSTDDARGSGRQFANSGSSSSSNMGGGKFGGGNPGNGGGNAFGRSK